jgi:uncharacterized protein HemX
MTKLYATLTAAAFALSMSGFAVAQQDDAKKQEEYQAALKKCDPMQGAEKTKCIDEAKKKHGQM